MNKLFILTFIMIILISYYINLIYNWSWSHPQIQFEINNPYLFPEKINSLYKLRNTIFKFCNPGIPQRVGIKRNFNCGIIGKNIEDNIDNIFQDNLSDLNISYIINYERYIYYILMIYSCIYIIIILYFTYNLVNKNINKHKLEYILN